MKIPKLSLFDKDADPKSKEGAQPQPDTGSQRERAFDSILAPRGQASASPQPPDANAAPAPDADSFGKLALGGLRSEAAPAPVEATPPPPPTEPAAPAPSEPAPQASEPVAPAATESAQPTENLQPDPLSALAADAPEPEPSTDAPTPGADQSTGGDGPTARGDDALAGLADAGEAEGGDDLLDIFRDAKDESEEGSLVKELDDVPIGELLTDVVSLSQQLGVTPTGDRKPEPVAESSSADDSDAEEEPEVQAATMRSAEPEPPAEQPAATTEPVAAPEPQPTPQPEPQPAATEPAAQPVPQPAPQPEAQPAAVESVAKPQPAQPSAEPAPQPAPPPAAQPAPRQNAAPQPAQQPPGDGAPRQQMLHVLMIGLSIALVAGVVGGSRGATDLFAANPSDATPAVLAYVNQPVAAIAQPTAVSEPTIVPTPVPTAVVATATPSPSPTPSPAPTPGPDVVYNFDPMAPAYYNYTVESGDSLTSMSRQFGICPDHILWNNPPRTEYTPLFVGDHLTMPGMPGVVHIVEPGDSIASLAARYSVSTAAIVAFPGNHLEEGEELRPGQRVLMPNGIPPEALLQDADAYEKTHVQSEYGVVWPYAGPVTTYFGEVRPNYIHYAIDIGGLGSYGQPVVAAAAGKVVFVGYGDTDYGNHVIVDHGDGRRTHYAHFQDVYVAQGQTVEQSQPLGSIGCTGASTGTHLHFELSQDGQLIDPLPLLP